VGKLIGREEEGNEGKWMKGRRRRRG